VYNPLGGPSDDLCPAPFDQAACVAALTAGGAIPIRDVLAGPPQQITGPLANEGADSSFTGIDFVPDVFVGGPVQPGAALYSLEGDFGFSPPNSSNPDAEIGHEVKLINFNQLPGSPLALSVCRGLRRGAGQRRRYTFCRRRQRSFGANSRYRSHLEDLPVAVTLVRVTIYGAAIMPPFFF